MEQNKNIEQFFIKKAYEICYAIMRIASSVKREGFARRLEENGLLLLEAAASGEFGKISRVSTVVEYLLRLGSDVGFVHPANAETISRELQHLNSAIAESASGGLVESGNAAKTEEISLEGIFSDQSIIPNPSVIPSVAKESRDCHASLAMTSGDAINSLENGNGQRSVAKAAIRQSAILERIRQNVNPPDGNTGCRLKDIQEVLPSVSERTLRYDLQRLLEQGLVERLGNGGPATSYRIKEVAFSG